MRPAALATKSPSKLFIEKLQMNFDFVFFQLNPAGSLLNPVELSLLRSQLCPVCIPRELRELSWPTSLTNIRRKNNSKQKK